MAVGVSFGGITLGNYLVAKGEAARTKLIALMFVSVCWDTLKGTESLEKGGLNSMLNRHLVGGLIEPVRKNKHLFDNGRIKIQNFDSVISSQTIWQFDKLFTAPQFGYKNVEDYYNDASLVGKLKNIKVPILAINADDDPCQVRLIR